MADPFLVDLLMPSPPRGRALAPFMRGTLTAWNASTGQNTVTVGSVVYTDLPVCGAAALALGPVLLARTDGRPVVLGPLTAYTAPDTGD